MKFYRKDAVGLIARANHVALEGALACLKGSHYRDPEVALRAIGPAFHHVFNHFSYSDVAEAIREAKATHSVDAVLESVPYASAEEEQAVLEKAAPAAPDTEGMKLDEALKVLTTERTNDQTKAAGGTGQKTPA
jgi:hypothetical protein